MAAAGTSRPPAAGEIGDLPYDDRQRFLLDLEFVQALANPHYVAWLGAAGYFVDRAFMAYLRSLDYWREPRYAVFLAHPAGLAVADLLVSSAAARAALARPDVADWVATQQYWQWKAYWGHRSRDGAGGPAAAPSGASVPPPPS